MPATEICALLTAWSRQYPVPSAPAGQNEAARAAEDKVLARFAGLVSLDRDQAAELVGWKFQNMAHRRALAMRGSQLTPKHAAWTGMPRTTVPPFSSTISQGIPK